MNYYKRHLGDYAKNTRTLTTYEHGVYNLVLDLYYTDEAPVSPEDAYAICRAESAKDRSSVDRVLVKFFIQDGGLWRHQRADEEIAKYREKSEKNKAIGSLGGKQKAKRIPSETLSESPEECLANYNPSHKPLAISQEKETPVVPEGDALVAQVLDAYHTTLPGCMRIVVLNPKRMKRIKTADKLAATLCRQQGWEYDRSRFWLAYFGECASDAWLRGDVPNPKNTNWKQNLDVLLAEDRFAGIMDRAIANLQEAA